MGGAHTRATPAAVSATKVTRMTRTVSQVGRSRHHDLDTVPRWTRTAAITRTGTATKNSQERATTAIAKARTAKGTSTRATMATNPVVVRSWSRNGGRASGRGHAARHQRRSRRGPAARRAPPPRPRRRATTGGTRAASRRSWKTSNGVGAAAWGASGAAPAGPKTATSSASSADGTAARASSPGWSRSRGRARLARSASAVVPLLAGGHRHAGPRRVVRGAPAPRRDGRAPGAAHRLRLGGGPRRAPGRVRGAGR